MQRERINNRDLCTVLKTGCRSPRRDGKIVPLLRYWCAVPDDDVVADAGMLGAELAQSMGPVLVEYPIVGVATRECTHIAIGFFKCEIVFEIVELLLR